MKTGEQRREEDERDREREEGEEDEAGDAGETVGSLWADEKNGLGCSGGIRGAQAFVRLVTNHQNSNINC